jgi:hypothetical protein
MRIFPFLLTFLAVSATAPVTCFAQRPQVVGISHHSSGASTNHLSVRLGSQRAASDGQSSLGTWVVLGALVGGLAGGIWAGVQISKSNDPMNANGAIAYVVGAGAIVGGVVGALAYLGFHPQNEGQ